MTQHIYSHRLYLWNFLNVIIMHQLSSKRLSPVTYPIHQQLCVGLTVVTSKYCQMCSTLHNLYCDIYLMCSLQQQPRADI